MPENTISPVDELLGAANSETPMSAERAETLLRQILANAVINHHARFESSLEAFATRQNTEHLKALEKAWNEGYNARYLMNTRSDGQLVTNPYRSEVDPEHAFDDLPVIDEEETS